MLGVGVETRDTARLAATGTEPAAAGLTAERVARETEIVIVAALVRHLRNPSNVKCAFGWAHDSQFMYCTLSYSCSRALLMHSACTVHLSGGSLASGLRAAEPADAVALVQGSHLLAREARRGVQPVAAFARRHTLALLEAQTRLTRRNCNQIESKVYSPVESKLCV